MKVEVTTEMLEILRTYSIYILKSVSNILIIFYNCNMPECIFNSILNP